jgi:peptidoglycan hydrolase CwlO-like protein
MNATVNPDFRDLLQEVQEMRVNLAKTQGEIEIIKYNSERNDKQTTRQFVLFNITMVIAVIGSLIGSSIFLTEALRREMDAKFGTVNQRFDSVNQRFDSIDQRLDSLDKKLDRSIQELKEEIRSRK